ncbi:endonuclease domain-containing protein [Sphingomonas floccifaciens]|uniref:Endonuclease domain-containing protein n=1 Tax=Sphingomonas floccifaciens TaxID=1844115 RepID=A0ABW4NCU5_9SPHN
MGIITFAFIAFCIFIGWHFRQEKAPTTPKQKFRGEPRAVASDPNWSFFIEQHCESPAEVAFLRAMVDAYELIPENGSLLGRGIRLDFQVEVGRYRLDFLANKWLIIEIDGAAYHSSEGAKARDSARDSYFRGLGYSVVRIAAKTVFNHPEEAVRLTDEALLAGKPILEVVPQKSGAQKLKSTVNAFADFGKRASDLIDIRNYIAPAELVFFEEKKTIEYALESAKMHASLQTMDPQELHDFNEHMDFLNKALGNATTPRENTIPAFETPNLSGNEAVDKEVSEKYYILKKERDIYFQQVLNNLESNEKLIPYFKKNLQKIGNQQLHDEIFKNLRS